MPYLDVIWDFDDDPNGNVQHIAEHDLTKDDVEYVLRNPQRHGTSRSSGRPMVFGYTRDDVPIAVIYEQVDEDTVYPITAFEVEQDD